MDIKGNFILEGGTYLNNIFIQFIADTDYAYTRRNRHFNARVGIRPFNRTIEDDDEDLIIPDAISTTMDMFKHVTFGEWVLIGAFIFGTCLFAVKKTYCVKLDECLTADWCSKKKEEE